MAPNVRPLYPRTQQRATELAVSVTAGRLAPMTRVAFRQELLAAQFGDDYGPGRPNGLSYNKWYELTGLTSRDNAGEYEQYEQQATRTVVWHRLGAGNAPQRFASIAADIRSGKRPVPSREQFLSEGLQMETNVSGLLEGIYTLLARQLNWDTYPRKTGVSDCLDAALNPPQPKKKKWLGRHEFWQELQTIFPPEWRESAEVVLTRILSYHSGSIQGLQIVEVEGRGEAASVKITALQRRHKRESFTGHYELTLTRVRTRTGGILSLMVRERVGDLAGSIAGRNETGHYLTPS